MRQPLCLIVAFAVWLMPGGLKVRGRGWRFDGWRLRGVWVVRFRIFVSSVQKEFAEERRMLLIEMSLQQSIQFLRAEVGA